MSPLSRLGRDLSRRRVIQQGAAWAALALAPAVQASDDRKPQLYYSDYFSFVGRDASGFVYLAHDNNRGQTGDEFFADHWIAMYDEATGWVDVQGSAHYPNPGKLLAAIPDSAFFQFRGSSTAGFDVDSRPNDMRWRIGAMAPVLHRESEDGIFWIGAAPSTLVWKGRTLEGRVLFEYLQRHNHNRFTAGFGGGSFQNFNRLYLKTSDDRDFYVHYHERKGGSDLTGRLVGCATWGGAAAVTGLDFKITETAAIPYRTTYRWPIAWSVGFEHGESRYRLELVTAERRLMADWETGGFAMSVVRGTISAPGRPPTSVVGWGELII